MAYVKLVDGTYPYEKDVINVIKYIADLGKCGSLVYGGRNIIYDILEDPYGMAEQFLIIQNKRSFSRRLYHLIITLEYSVDDACLGLTEQIANMVINMYPDYQSVFVVHEDKKNYLHIHMLFNNCPVNPDKKNLTYYFNICNIIDIVEDMVVEYIAKNNKYF